MEVVDGTGGVAEDVPDRHEEREEGVCVSRLPVVAGGEVGEECAAGSLEHVVSDVQDPEPNDEDDDGTRPGFLGEVVAGDVAEVGGVADEEDGDGYCE